MKKSLIVIVAFLFFAVSEIAFSQTPKPEAKPVEADPEAVFEVSWDGFGEAAILTGFFINKKGEIFEYENSEHFHDFSKHATVAPPGPQPVGQPDIEPTKEPVKSLVNEPMRKPLKLMNVEFTQKFLGLKYGSTVKKIGAVDNATLSSMISLIPSADAGNPPSLFVDGSDIVLGEYYGYYSDPRTGALKKVLIGISHTKREETCRENEAAKTLFLYLKKVFKQEGADDIYTDCVASDE